VNEKDGSLRQILEKSQTNNGNMVYKVTVSSGIMVNGIEGNEKNTSVIAAISILGGAEGEEELYRGIERFKNKEALMTCLKEKWAAIPGSIINSLFESMPQRCAEVRDFEQFLQTIY
jgi:hypothetical protein